MSEQIQPVAIRVKNSLARAGYSSLVVQDDGAGKITLLGILDTPNDRSVVMVLARTTAGVNQVLFRDGT